MIGHKARHIGFKKAAKAVEKEEGVSEERADAIIASAARNASAGAKHKNPNLKKVKG